MVGLNPSRGGFIRFLAPGGVSGIFKICFFHRNLTPEKRNFGNHPKKTNFEHSRKSSKISCIFLKMFISHFPKKIPRKRHRGPKTLKRPLWRR